MVLLNDAGPNLVTQCAAQTSVDTSNHWQFWHQAVQLAGSLPTQT
jgi:hypothetical protein